MTMSINGRTFTFQVASDVQRDGLAFEVWEQKGDEQTLVIEVFRQDPHGTLTVTVEEVALPFELYEYVITAAREELLPEGWSAMLHWGTEE